MRWCVRYHPANTPSTIKTDFLSWVDQQVIIFPHIEKLQKKDMKQKDRDDYNNFILAIYTKTTKDRSNTNGYGILSV